MLEVQFILKGSSRWSHRLGLKKKAGQITLVFLEKQEGRMSYKWRRTWMNQGRSVFKNPIESTKEEFKHCWPPQEVLYWTQQHQLYKFPFIYSFHVLCARHCVNSIPALIQLPVIYWKVLCKCWTSRGMAALL